MSSLIDFLSSCIVPVNLGYTLLLIIVAAYWGIVALGALDTDSLDIDFGGDGDLGIDGGSDLSIDGGAEAVGDVSGDVGIEGVADGELDGPGGRGAFDYLNLGDVPPAMFLSVVFVAMWAFGLLANEYFQNEDNLVLGAGVLVVNVVVSLHVGKFLAYPVGVLFGACGSEAVGFTELIGRHCQVTTAEVSADFGFADVQANGQPIQVAVRTQHGEAFTKGDVAVLEVFDELKNVYLISKLKEK